MKEKNSGQEGKKLLPLARMKKAAALKLPEGSKILKSFVKDGYVIMGLALLKQGNGPEGPLKPRGARQKSSIQGTDPGSDAFDRIMMKNVKEGRLYKVQISLFEKMIALIRHHLPDRYEKGHLLLLLGFTTEKEAQDYLDHFISPDKKETVSFQVPGLPGVSTFQDLLKSQHIRRYLTHEQIEQFEKAAAELCESSVNRGYYWKGEWRDHNALFYSRSDTTVFCTALRVRHFILYSDLLIRIASPVSPSSSLFSSIGSEKNVGEMLEAVLEHLKELKI